MSQQWQLPWWKQIVLDHDYRRRITKLSAERYREEMALLQDFPEQLAPAMWEDGTPIYNTGQYICVEENTTQWAIKHPESVVKVSSFRTLQTAAVAVAVPGRNEEEQAAHVLDEVRLLYNKENPAERLYGLSYVWNRPLPPNGFIRMWPDPLSAMWPEMLAAESPQPKEVTHALLGKGIVAPPPDLNTACAQDPLCVHVFRRNGEYLGAWRQSLLLVRYKVLCWALHEEERQRTCGAEGRPVLATDAPLPGLAAPLLLKGVPVFGLPLLRIQGGTTTFSSKTKCVYVDSIEPPKTWEGIAPAPSVYRAEQAYLNWHSLHRGSALVSQAVRDVYELLPHDADGLLTKETYVEFVLDLLNLFFPTYGSAMNLAIAEEEWVYRGTTELVNFEAFYEKFFSFPFIFLRDLNTVTREQYAEVWCLIRVCLLEDADSIIFSARCVAGGVSSAATSQGTRLRYGRLRQPTTILGATLNSTERLQRTVRRRAPPLISNINGVTYGDIVQLAETNFHNADNYPLHSVKQKAAVQVEKKLRDLPPSRAIAVVYSKSQKLLAQAIEEEKKKRKQPQLGKKGGMSMESESQFTANGRSVLSLLSSSPGPMESTSGGSESMAGRRAALEQIERERHGRELIATSTLYQHRRLRWQTERAKIHTHIARSHSAWEMYQQDVYEFPPETLDEEDALVAYVSDLPDDFFDDRQSLRVRYGVHAARLRALAKRRLGSTADTSQWSLDPVTLSSVNGDLGGLSQTPERPQHAAVSSPVAPAVHRGNVSITSSRSNAKPESRGGVDGCASPERNVKRSQHQPQEMGWDSLTTSIAKFSNSWGKTLPSEVTLPTAPPPEANPPTPSVAACSPSASSSSSFSWTAGTKPDENGSTAHTPTESAGRGGEHQQNGVDPKRAWRLRMRMKHNMDTRYAKLLQSRPRRFLPLITAVMRKSMAPPTRGTAKTRLVPQTQRSG
ncbi:hypothetical protein DQ04_07511000 [Trypanosoma grayi]|uniref:hypothetical protein n=1 Tax=Trypanosoma grayi TaxID=71804 RepID=UPI0004F4A22F|nr:hypothetical protein DQ04_07511000 [Trypanosoma grayi]KEG08293.1 hypothetical protein DQ04_07511000 [Trypanosoma grayi]